MATGTGKTLTAAAVVKLFLRSGNASRVLFLVGRLELEDQAKKAFAASTVGRLPISWLLAVWARPALLDAHFNAARKAGDDHCPVARQSSRHPDKAGGFALAWAKPSPDCSV